ncbi:MAG: CsgG/HfaB family protein [Treponema sp.]|jgi:hypothetical protein|nr:CsgG/HfaB family protein [Treponema sp.]
MKKPALFLSFCLAASLCAAQNSVTLDAALQSGAAYLRGRLPQNARVSALNIRSGGPELSDYALRRLSAALVNDGWFTVVERDAEALTAVSREMTYQLSGEVSDETSLSVGKQLGAEYIVSGVMTRSGPSYRLDLKTLRVDSAQVQAQWSAENIRADPLWADLDNAPRAAALVFTGESLSDRDRQTLGDALGRALQTHTVLLELDAAPPSPEGYVFTVNVHRQDLPPAPPSNTAMLRGEITVALSRNGRVLRRGGPYAVTELSLPLLLRRGAEQLQNDRAFFQALNQAVNP